MLVLISRLSSHSPRMMCAPSLVTVQPTTFLLVLSAGGIFRTTPVSSSDPGTRTPMSTPST
ncbi:hypothetical protein D3C84_1259890 [compost metagenome]